MIKKLEFIPLYTRFILLYYSVVYRVYIVYSNKYIHACYIYNICLFCYKHYKRLNSRVGSLNPSINSRVGSKYKLTHNEYIGDII